MRAALTTTCVVLYELLESAGLQEAVNIASRHPMAKAATIEVWPAWAELAGPAE